MQASVAAPTTSDERLSAPSPRGVPAVRYTAAPANSRQTAATTAAPAPPRFASRNRPTTDKASIRVQLDDVAATGSASCIDWLSRSVSTNAASPSRAMNGAAPASAANPPITTPANTARKSLRQNISQTIGTPNDGLRHLRRTAT